MAKTAESEAQEIDRYLKERNVEGALQDIMEKILKEKPANPRQWLLQRLEQDLSEETEDLSESDLHKLFAVTRRITAEIVPRDAIDMVISETMKILNCDIVSLFVSEKRSGMLLLFASNLDTPIRVSPGQGIAGSVFNSRETVNIPDCYKDRRFDRSFDKRSGYVTKSLIAVPIIDYEGASVGVLQAINKLPTNIGGVTEEDSQKKAGERAIPFMKSDAKILAHLTQHVAIALRNAEVFREAIASNERATGLLNTIQSLSQDLGTQSLLMTITMHANKIVSAQRSTVFLVDEANQQLWSVSTDTGQEIRIPKNAGIAGQCCTEGILINIPDAYADSRFNQAVDKKTGFKTQNILAVPMHRHGFAEKQAKEENTRKSLRPSISGSAVEEKEETNDVIGVIQMINKETYDGQPDFFDETDIETMVLFSKFVGPRLANSSMLSKSTGKKGDKAEAEMALSQNPDKTGKGENDTAKRASAVGMAAFAEGEEGEEQE